MRLVTFEMCIKVIRLLVINGNTIRTNDRHFAMIQNIRETSTLQLRSFYKGDDLFVDTFEGQYHHMKATPLNVEYITMDASLLLPLTATPLTGIDFIKRLPCGDNERTQRATYIFILMRELTLDLQGEVEHFLPLSKVANPVKQSEVLDLNNSDLIACTIVQQGRQSIRRFLVIDTSQFILVEPDTSKLGWGVVKFVSHLQDVEANPDRDDSRSLNIVIQQPFSRRSKSGVNPLPIMTAKFVFDDYIRCMSARQRLQKRRDALKHHKMATIASLLELPSLASPPSHFYSLTPFDNPVWSPSSRNYSSPQQTSSSPNITSPVNLNILSSSAQKSRLLSPKHEEILQKQLKQDVIDNKTTTSAKPKSPHTTKSTPAVFMNTPVNTPTKHEAEALASLLRHTPSPSPLEVSGHDLGRERTNTVEIGEEICEDSVTLAEISSSFVLINASTSVERHTTSETPKINKKQMPNKKDTNKQLSDNKNTISNTLQIKSLQPNKEINHQIQQRSAPISKSNLKVDSSDLKKCPSAPCSPNDRRRQQKEEESINSNRLSKSLPVMTLENPGEVKDRHKRAQRARAKAKSVKSKGGMKKLRK